LLRPNIEGVASQTALVHSITVKYSKALNGADSVEITAAAGRSFTKSAAYRAGTLWIVDARMPDRAALVPYEAQAQGSEPRSKRVSWCAPGGTGNISSWPPAANWRRSP